MHPFYKGSLKSNAILRQPMQMDMDKTQATELIYERGEKIQLRENGTYDLSRFLSDYRRNCFIR